MVSRRRRALASRHPDAADARLRVVHLARDRTGGAGRMALALHRALRDEGVDSVALVQEPGPELPGVRTLGPHLLVRLRERLDRAPLALYPRRTRAPYSPNLVPGGALSAARALRPTITHVHWLGGGFLSVPQLARLPGPVVLTLHDMWTMTGGCHYDDGCGRYATVCRACPVLGSRLPRDLSTVHQAHKGAALLRPDVTYVAISQWLARAAERSHVLGDLPGLVIPNGIDLTRFSPRPREESRARFGLDPAARVVGFGAIEATRDRRKGYDLLQQALAVLSHQSPDPVHALVFGGDPKDPAPLPCAATHLGPVHGDAAIADVLAACDVVVVPSRQEGFGLVTAEAMACSIPVVAFQDTGAADLIRHRETGWLAAPQTARALAEGIAWILGAPDRSRRLGAAARARIAAHFDIRQVARRYLSLYRRLGRIGP